LSTTIGPYKIVHLIGKGAMAEVYLCTDQEDNHVAVKWLSSSISNEARFSSEIDALFHFRHEHIIPIISQGIQDNRPFFAMRYIDGFDGRFFAEKLQQRPPSERHEKCCLIGKQIAQALHYIHEQGFIHRDVKPSNILIDVYDNAILTDFGTIKDCNIQDSEETLPGILIGTPFYAAPEQILGEKITPKVDQFALGVTLYFLLVNKRPFDTIERLQSFPAPSVYDPSIPASIEACILRLMATNPEDRFPDLKQVIEALSTDRKVGVPLAGRQQILKQISHCIHRVVQGEKLLVRMIGFPGAGRNWAADTLYNGSLRRGIDVFEIVDSRSAIIAQNRLQWEQPILIIDRDGRSTYPGVPLITIEIAPLCLADIRRSLYAYAAQTENLSQQAEHLSRLTGGLPVLLIPLLQRYSKENNFSLPQTLPILPEVQQFFQGLDWEEIEVLAALSISSNPLTDKEIETITLLLPKEILCRLHNKGLCLHQENTWTITNELFALEAKRLAPDLETLQSRLELLNLQVPSIDIRLETVEIENLCALGQLASAKKRAVQLTQITQHSSDRRLYCNALLLLGKVYLDIGSIRKAEALFADLSALSKALQYDDIRYLSHTYRARLSLEKHNSSRSGAAAAVDRLLPLLSSSDPMIHSIWNWAIASFGDIARWRKSTSSLLPTLASLPKIKKIRCYYCIIRGASIIGEHQEALQLITYIQELSLDYPFLHWEIMRAKALLTGEKPPVTAPLAYNLEPEEIMLLKRRWIQAQGISPDPTWND